MHYIVHGTGRTGSLLLASYLAPNDFYKPGGLVNGLQITENNYNEYIEKTKLTDNIVIHTHYLQQTIDELKIPPSESILILSKRRNCFNTVMSGFIASASGEYYPYTDKQLESFTVDPGEFVNLYRIAAHWPNIPEYYPEYKDWLKLPWLKIHMVYFEDFLNNENKVEFLSDLLNISADVTYHYEHTGPSPRHYSDYITNWKELKQLTFEIDKDIELEKIHGYDYYCECLRKDYGSVGRGK